MAVGFDFGTNFIVSARKNEEGKTLINSERNCFFAVSADFEDIADSSGFKFIRDIENGEEKLFILGRDALKISNLYAKNDVHGERKTGLRRPMQNMVINSKSEKKAIQILKYLSQSVIGPPKYEGEVAVISIPADPISGEFNNIFHSNLCQSFIAELGYEVYPVNEALSIVYAMAPSCTSEEGDELPMTAISTSWGAGGTNGCLAYKGADTIRFALDRGGDWIDQQTSMICNMTSSEVMVSKEKLSKDGKLDLSAPCYDSDILSGLYIYYHNLVTTVVKQFKDEFIRNGTQFSDPIEYCVSGGTSKPNGFEKLVEQVIKEVSWPFDIKGVRRAQDPLSATAVGALAAAISREKKKIK